MFVRCVDQTAKVASLFIAKRLFLPARARRPLPACWLVKQKQAGGLRFYL
jgi:hypothetical protein